MRFLCAECETKSAWDVHQLIERYETNVSLRDEKISGVHFIPCESRGEVIVVFEVKKVWEP